MFTAAKVISRIEESDNIEGLDRWLENYICKKFVESDGYAITIPPAQIKQQGWKHKAFMRAMGEREFIVQFFPDQRDSGEYYLISLPSSKENKVHV